MKTTIGTLLAASSLALSAQVAPKSPAPKSAVEIIAPEPARSSSVDTNSLSAPKPQTRSPEDRFVKYSGFLSGWKKGDKPAKILSLRNPADPRRDAENLLIDLPTETRRGIKLFSIDF